jgi:glyoxalase family protein
MDGHRDEAAIAARTWPEPVPAITPDMRLPGIHHITVIGSDIERTTEFYVERLGLNLVKRTMNFDDPTSPHYYYGLGLGEPGSLITYFERSPQRHSPVLPGAGQTHHFAFHVAGEDEQNEWRERLLSAGLAATEVRDYKYFKSFHFEDPFGHILEITSSAPGFTVDESADQLGSRLMLPDWMEKDREWIETQLVPIRTPLEAAV